MLLLGIDIGTSSVKVSVVDVATTKTIISVSYPETESEIISLQPGWAEQQPMQWWLDARHAILKAHASHLYNPHDIAAIGIAYQMHGLVLADKDQQVLRDAIIWCDSRAVPYGDAAFEAIGNEQCLSHLLNSPGNFTAAKLAWVKEHEPEIYSRIDKIMLPGDFIAMKLTGQITTSISALSEGIFWDFKEGKLSDDVFNYFGFSQDIIPEIKHVFTPHGGLLRSVAVELGLKEGIPVSYKAGDQPNNALSLNVMRPGEVAATAGTSGVIYAVTDQLFYDHQSRVNGFAHVNHLPEDPHIGVLLCINGTGIMNRWVKNMVGKDLSYQEANLRAGTVKPGSEGLFCLPFGNGAERMLCNKQIQAHFQGIDLNVHSQAHLFRAAQEGIAFAFRYGLDIMRENGLVPSVVKAGRANMFLSDVFTQAFVNATGLTVEMYNTDGSVGAALGAGIGAGIYKDATDAFSAAERVAIIEPGAEKAQYETTYRRWKELLEVNL